MKLHLIAIQHERGEVITHAVDQDEVGNGTLCGKGLDWRLDRVLGKLHDPHVIECPTRVRA